jgi:ParB/RepB/Spo0J family partition protein
MTEINLESIVSNNDNSREPAPTLQGQGYGVVEPTKGARKPSLFALALGSPDDKAHYCNLIDELEDGVADLAKSIERQGQLQNCGVRLLNGGKYALTFGARRCLAVLYLHAKNGKPAMVTATISKANNKTAVIESAAENIHLPPSYIDQARLFQRLLDQKLTVKEIAKVYPMGKATEQNIRHRLTLLDLPKEAQLKVHHGKMSQDAALKLLKKTKVISKRTPVSEMEEDGTEEGRQQPMPDEGESQAKGKPVRRESLAKEKVLVGTNADLDAILQNFLGKLRAFNPKHLSPDKPAELLRLIRQVQKMLATIKGKASKIKLAKVG